MASSQLLSHVSDAVAFMNPPPLSPYFQAGGAFEGYNEDLTFALGFLVLVFLIDRCIVRPFFCVKARYFALHAIINAIVCAITVPDVYATLTGPMNTAFIGPSSTIAANSLLFALHLYHMLAFKVTAEDIFHHLMFVGVLCPLVVPYKWNSGKSNNFAMFFLSGLPGGIDYVLLVLHYHGLLSRKTEKEWFATVNVWLRGPGLVTHAFLAYTNWLNPGVPRLREAPIIVCFMGLLLTFYNGQLYSRQAVESLVKFNEKARAEADAAKAAKAE